MSDSAQEKTEAPSPKKLRQARERGEIPFSREAVSCGAALAVLATLWSNLPALCVDLLGFAQDCFRGGDGPVLSRTAVHHLLTWMGLLGGVGAGVALVLGVLQTRFFFRLRFRWSSLNPVQGLGRLFRKEKFLDLAWMLVKVASLVFLGVWLVLQVGRSALVVPSGPEEVVGVSQWLVGRLLVVVGATTLVFGALDWYRERRRFQKKMRMTKEEARRENKEEEGDPQVKAERRRIHRQILQGGVTDLKRASLVLINPTHIAVALCYRAEVDEAPWVVARGREEQAYEIRKAALRLGIPVVEHIVLARQLIQIEAGDPIPESLYSATAEVLRLVQSLSGNQSAPTENRSGRSPAR